VSVSPSIFDEAITAEERVSEACAGAPAGARSVPKAPRIGVIYPSGWGNLGDEAILQATFQALRQRWPETELRAFTLHPARTAANHGVAAEPLTGVNRPLFCAPREEEPFPVRAARSIARRTRRVPLMGQVTRWASDWTADMVFEAKALARAWRWLRSADLLLASGGGQLDDVWGGAWGQPYALARWAWLAKRAGVPFAFLSVGYGGASTWLSRRLLRYAVEQATYCSVRDSGSRALTAQLGIKRDIPIVPDLAFALTCEAQWPRRRPGYDVGISPMTYLRPGSWPSEDAAEYQRLVGLWADLVTATVIDGNRVQLFVSAPEDMVAVNDVWDRLDETTRADTSINQATSPDSLLEFYRGVDMAISSRLHGVLLAMVAARPVLALSHERKVRTVMDDAGMSAFCADLTTASADETMAILRDLTDHLDSCGEGLRVYVANARASVVQQQELLPQLLKQSQ
jgi:polysaccharide pyruvyl transferase WcaK-like protein